MYGIVTYITFGYIWVICMVNIAYMEHVGYLAIDIADNYSHSTPMVIVT